MRKKYAVKFTKKAYKEYDELDGTIIDEVDSALESLAFRADVVGKKLGKKYQIDLIGTKEKKLRSSGIRIIYYITNKQVDVLEIVEILLVDYKKNETEIYQEAELRYHESLKQNGTEDFNYGLYWNYEESIDLDESSMIDQIFNEDFDDLEEEIKQDILENYSHGNVELAYQIWLTSKDNI
jgi:mRNA-degrading endonuclease RelE of RelBE toxin-antitoxin system